MKTSALLLWLYLASCMGQLTFNDPFVSKAGEGTVDSKPQGNLVTVSTEKGFAWLLSDSLPSPFNFYMTLKCVSSGSTSGLGLVQRVAGGYPASYTKASQIMPFVGSIAARTDIYAYYAPSKPVKAISTNWGIPNIYSVDDTVHMSGSSSIVTTINGQSTGAASLIASSYGVGFEVLNCGSSVWCVQDATQYAASPGDCDPGNTAPTCPTLTTCANPPFKTDCSSAASFFFYDSTCLTQCYSDTGNTAVKAGVTVCVACNSPCQTCSGTLDSCTSCIAGYYLYQGTCDTSCPAGTVKNDATMECDPCTSPCKNCDETQTECTSCIASNYLYQSSCDTSCPDGTVKNDVTMECDPCTSPCENCDTSKTQCTSCIASNYLYQEACDTSCPSGTVKNDATMECDLCTSPCKNCDITKTQCSSCIADHYLYEETCVSTCPTGYEADIGSGKCKNSAEEPEEPEKPGKPGKTTATSQGIAAWKLGLAIGLPVSSLLGLSIYFAIKFAAKRAAMKMTGQGFKQIRPNQISPTNPTAPTSPIEA